VLSAFLNVGAAQGMSAQQTLIAVHQAILGIDEGTDKLFQKNPSVIYKEFAAEIGTTAGKLTDQQKAQALVNEAMEASLKVGDAYGRFLETTVGKQSELATASERLQVAVGKMFEPFRAFLVGNATGFLNWLTGVVERLDGIIDRIARIGVKPGLGIAGFVGAMIAGDGGGSDWDMGDTAFDGVKRGGSSTADPKAPAKPLSKSERARIRREYGERVLGLANMDETMQPAEELALRGLGSFGGTRDDRINVSGALTGGAKNRPGQRLMDLLRQDLFEGLQRLQPFARGLQGFFSDVFSGARVGTSMKNFGREILAGMGSIFAQMAMRAIMAAPLFIALGKAMSNPFTAGFALLAFGVALKALGSAMGGDATGGGGGGGSADAASRDRTTNITLTADGAGGFKAPKRDQGQHFTVIGASDPRAHRIIGDISKAGARRNIG
jgi:hypothetical protein